MINPSAGLLPVKRWAICGTEFSMLAPIITFWILILLGGAIGVIVWSVRKVLQASDSVEELTSRIISLETEIYLLKNRPTSHAPGVASPFPAVLPPVPVPAIMPPPPLPPGQVIQPAIPAVEGMQGIMSRPPQLTGIPPPPFVPPPPVLPPVLEPVIPLQSKFTPVEEPVMAGEPAPEEQPFNLERFMGAKLLGWIGGILLFLGVGYFIKYSFDNNLISPQMRIVLGFLTGIGLLIGGFLMSRRQYPVMAQTLCATGILILYGVTFASHSLYHLLDIIPTFLLMVLITATAFSLAVGLGTQVIAILGLIGGFLTPLLLSTGKDNPLGLFGYISILDVGLVMVALRQRWNHLVLMGAIGTIVMQAGWVLKFFEVSKVFVAMSIFLGFEALFLAAFICAHKFERTDIWISISSVIMPFVVLGFTLFLLNSPELGREPWKIFAFVLAADLGLLTLVFLDDALRPAHVIAGSAVFVILGIWTAAYLSTPLLNWGLGCYLVFGILHSIIPVVLQRLRPETTPPWWGHLFPLLALLLVMIPVVRIPEVSWLIWPCVALLDLIAIALAIFTASVLSIVGVLILTLILAGVWILKVPAQLSGLPEVLTVIGGFAIFFFAGGIFAARQITARLQTTGGPDESAGETKLIPPHLLLQIPALSVIMPFLLLLMVIARLPLMDPSPVFGLALLLVALLLGVARYTAADWLVAIGLACTLILQCAWHSARFNPGFAVVPLGWYVTFFTIFAIYPFIFRRAWEERILPWAVAALSGPLHFYLIYELFKRVFPNSYMGLLPAAFAVPTLLGLFYLVRHVPEENPIRNSQLAWFGGVTLFFVTLIFPIQFERQWITIGWALEGAALLWFFHRVPHPGLRLVGFVLLMVAFVRLVLNPAVLSYHPRAAVPILNWYLYTYGIVTISLMAGGRLLAPPRNLVCGCNGPPILYTLGTVLAFLLMNIEIADYFAEGSTLTFRFSGNFARDMTYSIAWAIFAFGLLIVGFVRRLPAVRYAGIALVLITVLKLFLHDLSRLPGLYRIGALVSVAIILMLIAYLFQRFQLMETRKDKSQE